MDFFNSISKIIPFQDTYPLADPFLHAFADRHDTELAVDSNESADSYVDAIVRYSLLSDAMRNFENSDGDFENFASDNGDSHPIPSIRDQEKLQHSSLWSYNAKNDGILKSAQTKPQYKIRVKNEASLPAYCNPPNPCPVGYTEDQQCTTDFENTSAFSRDYQAAQECMCDDEHMFNCPPKKNVNTDDPLDFDSDVKMLLSKQFELLSQQHKNLVAQQDNNPYLAGDKLPIAAKKGTLAYWVQW